MQDVEGRKLIQPTFHYTPRGGQTIHIFADEATLHFDMAKRVVRVTLVNLNGVVPDHESFRGHEEPGSSLCPRSRKSSRPAAAASASCGRV